MCSVDVYVDESIHSIPTDIDIKECYKSSLPIYVFALPFVKFIKSKCYSTLTSKKHLKCIYASVSLYDTCPFADRGWSKKRKRERNMCVSECVCGTACGYLCLCPVIHEHWNI